MTTRLAKKAVSTASRADADVPYPADTSAILANFIKAFRSSGQPIEVSFRDLVPWIKVGERATHYIHSYPAKLLPQIAHFFLAAKAWAPVQGAVLDPFGGTGTVALEALLSGRRAMYADVNPLAHLISRAKTSSVNAGAASAYISALKEHFQQNDRDEDIPWIVNIDRWYTEQVRRDLARLRATIDATVPPDLADFTWTTFSSVARKCSLADPRFSVPVRRPQYTNALIATRDVWSVFEDQYFANLKRHLHLSSYSNAILFNAVSAGNDARNLCSPNDGTAKLADNSIDLILTSPPYAGAQKYIRASSLSLGWLGLAGPDVLRSLEDGSIGRERFRKGDIVSPSKCVLEEAKLFIEDVFQKNQTRATICTAYLNDMDIAIGEMIRVLKPAGHLVLVIGDNTVCGEPFQSARYLRMLAERRGAVLRLQLDDTIKSRALITKRSGGASVIKTESVMVFSK